MRFDELVLRIPGDELRVRFHPRMTVLSGLGAPERQALAESILGALTGGGDAVALRYLDGTGRTVNALTGPGGSVQARHDDDGSPAPAGRMPAVRRGSYGRMPHRSVTRRGTWSRRAIPVAYHFHGERGSSRRLRCRAPSRQ